MTLPTSGPLSLNDIKGEFGGPASPSLGDYYAGGTYVPAGTSGTYGAVPTAGNPISIRDFYGTSSVVVAFTSESITSDSYQYDFAGYTISSNGTVVNTAYGSSFTYEQWVTPTSAASGYEVKASLLSGSTPSGTLGSWVACSGSPTWYLLTTGNQTLFCSLSLQVRKTGSTSVIQTWTIDLSSTSYSY